MLGSLLPKELKTCLYLDVDMLALGDFRQCFAIDLKDKILGAVLIHPHPQTREFKARNCNGKFVYDEKAGHFNSGFMLVDLSKWREFGVDRKSIDFLSKYDISFTPDENTLNAVVTTVHRLNLPLKFNAYAGLISGYNNKRNIICLDDEPKANAYILPFTKKEFRESEEDILIYHYIFLDKAWRFVGYLNFDTDINIIYYKLWWNVAIDTPIFDKELLLLRLEVQDKFTRDFITRKENELLSIKEQEQRDFKFELLNFIDPKLTSAVVRVKNELAYKFGRAILENSKSFSGYLKMPLVLFSIYKAHKKGQKIYKERIFYNANLQLPPFKSHADYTEALKVKEHLSYKLGSAFLKGLKTWYKFGLIKFYFEAKKLEREFKENRG